MLVHESSSRTNEMITVRNLTKKIIPINKEILSNISFQIDEGEFIILLGASGSGKSTLLRCLALREKWDGGQLIYEGKQYENPGFFERLKLYKEWAYLEEMPFLPPNKTAIKIVLGGRFFHLPVWRKLIGKAGTDDYVMGMDYLESVGLINRSHLKAEKLSGGERQRVAIARALVQGARMIVIDEPVSGLDPESAHKIMEDLQLLCRKKKVTLVCSINQIELAEKYATRIWGLSESRLVLDIPARRLTQREKSLFL